VPNQRSRDLLLRDQLAENGLVLARGVEVRGVDEVATAFEVTTEDGANVVLRLAVRGVETARAEVHRAKGQPADAQAGVAKQVVLVECHDDCSFRDAIVSPGLIRWTPPRCH
jgi:hypothetical protein